MKMNWKKKEERRTLVEYQKRMRPAQEDEMGLGNFGSSPILQPNNGQTVWIGPDGKYSTVPPAIQAELDQRRREKEFEEHLIWAKERLARV